MFSAIQSFLAPAKVAQPTVEEKLAATPAKRTKTSCEPPGSTRVEKGAGGDHPAAILDRAARARTDASLPPRPKVAAVPAKIERPITRIDPPLVLDRHARLWKGEGLPLSQEVPTRQAMGATDAKDLDALAALLTDRARVMALVEQLKGAVARPVQPSDDATAAQAPQRAEVDVAKLCCDVAHEVAGLAEQTAHVLGGIAWRDRDAESQQQWLVRAFRHVDGPWQNEWIEKQQLMPQGWEPIHVDWNQVQLRKRVH